MRGNRRGGTFARLLSTEIHPSHPSFIMLYLSDYTYKVFEMIEARGLQFALPPEWKPVYRDYLKQKKINKLIEQVERLALERELHDERSALGREIPPTQD
jgi:hypothetical protein